MQYASYGFAVGFCLLSLVFPLECFSSETRISVPDAPESDERGVPGNSSHPRGDGRHHDPGLLVRLCADPDLGNRVMYQHTRGYRRITADNVLEHETRHTIFELICQFPGIDLTRLARLSGCNERTLRYHIDRISEEKYITIFNQGKSFHFFEIHNRFSVQEQRFLSYHSSGQSRKILTHIRQNPGITRKELAEWLGIASPTVTRMVQVMANDGCVILEKCGKHTRHYLPAHMYSIMKKMEPAIT